MNNIDGAPFLSYAINHVWQSTLFAAIAWLLAVTLLRNNRPQSRYAVWVAASLKFLVPFAALIDLGGRLGARLGLLRFRAPGTQVSLDYAVSLYHAMDPMAPQFVPSALRSAAPGQGSYLPSFLLVVWGCGVVVVAIKWWISWRRVRGALRGASPLRIFDGIPVLSSSALRERALEPGVFGIRRPVILVPDGVTDRLSAEQVEAVLAHESCHARRRDNLAAAIHMTVEALFWFHPLVWWLGRRMMQERERACDEDVLRRTNDPEVYAEGILTVCRFYLESPLRCVAGITGSNLKQRIEEIMTQRVSRDLSFGRKLLLCAAGVAVAAVPLAIGILNVPRIHAQSPAQSPVTEQEFEIATVKRSLPPQGNLMSINLGSVRNGKVTFGNVSLSDCLKFAYGVVSDEQIAGPDWIKSMDVRFDIVAQGKPDTSRDQFAAMLQTLLAERFGLVLHHEQRPLSFLALVAGKNAPRLPEAKSGDNPASRGRISGNHMSMQLLATLLSRFERQTVVDMTGLKGEFEVHLEWTPTDAAVDTATGPSLFTAVQEQLGLKLESRKGPLDVLVVDKAEKIPADN